MKFNVKNLFLFFTGELLLFTLLGFHIIQKISYLKFTIVFIMYSCLMLLYFYIYKSWLTFRMKKQLKSIKWYYILISGILVIPIQLIVAYLLHWLISINKEQSFFVIIYIFIAFFPAFIISEINYVFFIRSENQGKLVRKN